MASPGHNGLRHAWLPETCSCYHQACQLVWSHAHLRQELFQEYLENLEVHFVKCEISFEWLMVASPCYITRYLGPLPGVGGAARFLVVGTIDRQRGKTTTGSALDGAVLHSNTGLSSTQYEQIPITFGVWPFWLNPFFFFWSITFWQAYGSIVFHILKLLSFFWLTYYFSIGPCFSVTV